MRLICLPIIAVFLTPSVASAQWSVTTFTGTSWTKASNITIDRPAVEQALTFEKVRFDARPFEDAPYYGLRATRFFGQRRRLGVELELLHNKVYARTGELVDVQGRSAGGSVNGRFPLNAFVYRYNHTHGLNFLLANLVWRRPFGGSRFALMLRGGAGPVVPGRDIVMPDLNVQGYEYAGLGSQVAAGVSARFSRLFSALVEYKFTYTRPEIDLDTGGRGRMTAASQHIVAGLVVGR
jgi:hypothetical protein